MSSYATIRETSWKAITELSIGVVEPRLDYESLPSLPHGYRWALCDGSALSQQQNPIAFSRMGSSLPKLEDGATLVQEGDFGYKSALAGDVGPGALPCPKGDYMHSGWRPSGGNLGWIGGEINSEIYAAYGLDPGVWVTRYLDVPEEETGNYISSYPCHNSFAANRFPRLNLSRTTYEDADEGDEGEQSTPYQEHARSVIPQHWACPYYTIIDEANDAMS